MTTTSMRSGWWAGLALALTAAACGGGASGAIPIQGSKRSELCESVENPPAFRCPSGSRRHGKPPPEGHEMWCQRWDGTRHGSYRRFPPGAAEGAEEPAFVSDGTVVGEYSEGQQQGAWWTRQPGVDTVNVAYYQKGALVQRVRCRKSE